MKKILSVIFTSMLTVSALPITSSVVFADSEEIKRGDVNGDGLIDASDASEILEIYSELSISSSGIDEAVKILADYNGDGFVDSDDASAVLQLYAENATLGNKNYAVSVTTDISDEELITSGGILKPGTTVITVNVNNNDGFALFDFVLDIGSSYDIIKDTDGRPAFNKCPTVNYNSYIETAVNDNTVVINGIFAYDCVKEGGIIKLYAKEKTDGDKTVSVKSSSLYSSRKWREYGSGAAYHEAGCPLISSDGEIIERHPIENNSVYMVGDINGDMKIDLTDAFDAFHTAYTATNSGFSQISDLVWKIYFPNITDVRAAFLWSGADDSADDIDSLGRYTTDTAHEILKYCADISAGKEHISDSYITEIRHIG